MPKELGKKKPEVRNQYPFPHDILLVIFNYLDNHYELGRLSFVSKLFNQLAKDDRLWKKFLPLDVTETAVNSQTALSKKTIFANNPEYRQSYIEFGPMTVRIEKIKADLADLKKSESHFDNLHRCSLYLFLCKKIEPIIPTKVKAKIKSALFDLSFNQKKEIIESVERFHLPLIISLVNCLSERSVGVSGMDSMYLLSFRKDFFLHLIKYGDKAAVLHPHCLESLLKYVESEKIIDNLRIFLDIIRDEKIATHPRLVDFFDDLIKYLKSPRSMGIAYDPTEPSSVIVDFVLAKQDRQLLAEQKKR